MNPYSTFPNSPAAFAGGFCCDQRVEQDPANHAVIWALLYNPTGTTASDTGGLRIAIANSEINLQTNNWTYYSFDPSTFGVPAAGNWIDYPQMHISSNYLYITANIFRTTDNSYNQAVVAKMPLSSLESGSGFSYTFWNSSNGTGSDFSLAPAQNASSTMYFASLQNSNTVKVYWNNEGDTILHSQNVGGLNTTYFGSTSNEPDGTNWLARDDSRIQAAYVSGGQLGLMWDSGQGGSFAQPFVRDTILNTSDLSVAGQPDIFNSSYAFAYPSASVDSRGHIGGSVFYGGPSNYPAPVGYVSDDVGRTFVAATGGSGGDSAWGDFTSSVPSYQDSNTWVSAGWVENSGTVTPVAYWFGRNRDDPGVLPPQTDVGDTVSGAAPTGIGSSGGSYSNTDNIWSTSTGASDVDMYSLSAAAGSTLTATTSLPNFAAHPNSMDTILRVFDANGNQVAVNDDNPAGGTLYSSVTYTVPTAGTYYIGVSGYANFSYSPFSASSGTAGSTGDYTINMNLSRRPRRLPR